MIKFKAKKETSVLDDLLIVFSIMMICAFYNQEGRLFNFTSSDIMTYSSMIPEFLSYPATVFLIKGMSLIRELLSYFMIAMIGFLSFNNGMGKKYVFPIVIVITQSLAILINSVIGKDGSLFKLLIYNITDVIAYWPYQALANLRATEAMWSVVTLLIVTILFALGFFLKLYRNKSVNS